MNLSYDALQEVRSLRAQLKTLASQALKGKLTEAVEALDQTAAAFEGTAQRWSTAKTGQLREAEC
jgi:hypothetical protein